MSASSGDGGRLLPSTDLDAFHGSLAQALHRAEQDSLIRFASICLFKVVPIIEVRSGCTVDEQVTEWLRSLEAERETLTEVLRSLRDIVERPASESVSDELSDACSMAAEMVRRAFENGFRIREWADWCSTLVLDIHQEFDALLHPGDNGAPIFYPAAERPELTPMEALELRDQVAALDLLRRGVGSDQLSAINEEGNARVASALSRIVGWC
ncbi:hypothetical protein ADL25_05975 [Streptomyces sp. NRRL F-5122]|uniref:hypothetical protein n=1 Tax=Streptomyces sp. NRRL F-5122 TaxID=1609098 RepID=UPI00074134EF|nr:hypothetical protein [Streptomyces sp. NRRL F-5122]KUJ54700.1 hypothetical protein ADL25_05975 [Streptomyces sp. NRRL F-5122]